ncbi:hypothetical protein B0H10DRAFT_1944296 [Mycena sp. CBHHK59/15]|nr:hypothetical protein B0H10DRAFT_1944296 [Mycena sp. CBHHK59/15]
MAIAACTSGSALPSTKEVAHVFVRREGGACGPTSCACVVVQRAAGQCCLTRDLSLRPTSNKMKTCFCAHTCGIYGKEVPSRTYYNHHQKTISLQQANLLPPPPAAQESPDVSDTGQKRHTSPEIPLGSAEATSNKKHCSDLSSDDSEEHEVEFQMVDKEGDKSYSQSRSDEDYDMLVDRHKDANTFATTTSFELRIN